MIGSNDYARPISRSATPSSSGTPLKESTSNPLIVPGNHPLYGVFQRPEQRPDQPFVPLCSTRQFRRLSVHPTLDEALEAVQSLPQGFQYGIRGAKHENMIPLNWWP